MVDAGLSAGAPHGGLESWDIVAPPDPEGAAVAYARCCKSLFRAAEDPRVAALGSRARPPFFLDAVFHCSNFLGVQTSRDTDACQEILDVLRGVVAACEATASSSPADASAAFLAHNTIGFFIIGPLQQDRDRSARHFRRALALAKRFGPLMDERAQHFFDCTAKNLAALEAKTPRELRRAVLANLAEPEAGGVVFTMPASDFTPSARPAAGGSPGRRRPAALAASSRW